ncbi:MAG: recombinase family protein, partial [Lachnospiraceae bacterium]|nr:recombinase family protein [Lachnospiraceae bacterium]
LEKEQLNKLAGNEITVCEEIKELIKFLEKTSPMKEFEEESFLKFVSQITVYSREEIGFELKCGLLLKERMVR